MPRQPSNGPEEDDTTEAAAADARCNLCGRELDATTGTGDAGTRRPICDACLRGHVPRISANLNKPWWR